MTKYNNKDIDNKSLNTATENQQGIKKTSEGSPERVLPAHKKIRMRIILPIAVVILLALAVMFFHNDLAYVYAEWRFNSGDYITAKGVFEGLNGFKDSQDYLTKIYYIDACNYMEAGDYQNAIELFSSIKEYADSKVLLSKCYTLWADDYFAEGNYENAAKCYSLSGNTEGVKKSNISWGDQLYTENDFTGAIEKWQPYVVDEDVDTRISHAEYELASKSAASGGDYAAVLKLNDLNYDDRAHEAVDALLIMDPEKTDTLAVSDNHIVYIASDGSVRSDGSNSHGQGDVSSWAGVVSLCASELNSYGLTYDGKVFAAGSNAFGQCDVSDWSDIIYICAADNAVFGLKLDGTVVFSGGDAGQYDAVLQWANITELSAGKDHVAAIDKAGTTYTAGNNEYGQCDAAGTPNIASVVCAPYRTILISTHGKVSISGIFSSELTNSISGWSDIIHVSSSYSHIVAQDGSGILVAAGENNRGQCKVTAWKDINRCYARANFTVGVRSDGSVVTSVAGHTLNWKVLVWR